MTDAQAAVLTGGGRGAISAIRVWGSGCAAIVDNLFRPRAGGTLSASPAGRLRVGTLGGEGGDEVVGLKIQPEPPVFEFQGHAGTAVLTRSLDVMRSLGVVIESDEQWLRAVHGDTLETQALIDLKSAPTLNVAERLIDQSQGVLSEALRRIRGPSDLENLELLIARGDFGCRMSAGWTVALAGRPNVGKSALFNALLGFRRAIVNPAAGTTRDRIRARAAVGGWPVEFIDMAGIRQSDDPIEKAGIEGSEALAASADVLLLILDRAVPLEDSDRALLRRYPHAVRVANKSDLPASWELPSDFLNVSARTDDGLERLLVEIQRRIVPEPPPEGCAIPFRASQAARLHHLRQALLENEGPLPADLPAWVASG
jgi:tRNA modification GTPase